MTDRMVKGRKKGGGGGGTEAPDSLRSIQTARLVDLLSEGPIKGLVNGLKSVYLDGVPITNPDGTSNFTGVTFGFLDGSPGQAGLPGFDSVESERAVGTEVREGAPVTQTIVNTAVDQVRVTISVPQLTTLNTQTGDMTGSSFSYAIDVQSSGGGFVRLYTDTITGKTTNTYKKAVRLKLPGAGPWDVRVVRLTANSTSSAITNKSYWDSMTEIQSVKQRFTNSSVAGLQVSAELFGRVPARAYDVLGLMVRVPVNYDPIAGTYSGVWNGTFKLAWTNNPAWIFFDLATHPRYGLGRFIKDAHLDKWRLYEIGRYCDERVSNGQGGTEPRFTCNLYLQTAVQARQALQDLASLMRAITFWGSSQIGVVQDAPADATMLFTRTNVVGDFSYQGASRKTRHSAWTVYFNDLSQLGRRVPVVHVDPDLVKAMGVVMETASPIGCTSRGQALRLGRWMAYSEANGRTVSFRAGAEAAALGPGSVFKIADPAKAGKRFGGRVSAATTLAVTLDADVEIAAGETYQLEVMFPDATAKLGYRTEKRSVTTGTGTVRTLQVAPSFSAAPANGSIWVLQSSAIEPTWWRVVARKEAEAGHAYDIVGVAHDPDKFTAIEQGLKVPPRRTTGLNPKAPQVTSLTVTEVPYLDVDSTRIKAVVSWPAAGPGLTYQVERRLNLGEWVRLPETSSNAVELEGLTPGSLDLRVTTVNSLGITSVPYERTVALIGWKARPDAVEDFAAETVLAGIAMSWSPSKVSNFKETVIKVGAELATAEEVFRGAATRYTWHPPEDGTYTLWIRHYNTSGLASLDAATLDVDYVEISPIGLALQSSSQIFRVSAAGAGSPASITFTASDYKVLANLAWSVSAGTAVVTGAGASRTLSFANMGSDSVTVRVSEGTDVDEITVVKLVDGADGKSAINMLLSNEAHVLPADALGVVSSFAGASTTARVFLGTTDDTTSWTFSISPSAGVSASLVTAGGIPSVSVSAMSTDSGYVDISATRTGFASPPALRFSLAKSRAGNDAVGLNTAQVFIYQRSTTGAPARPSATVTYTFASGAVSGLNNGWSSTWPGGTGPVYVSLASAVSASGIGADDIAPGEWAVPQVAAQDGAPGTNGLNSATVYLYRRNNVGLSGFSVPSTTLTYTFSSGLLTGALEGWSQTMPDASAGRYLIVTQASALGTGVDDLIGTGEWAAATVMAQDGGPGANGLSSAQVYIYQRSSIGAPARPSATVTFYFATGAISGLNNGWSSTWPSGTGPVYVSLASAASSSSTDEIAPGEWAAPQLAAQDGAPGANGLNSATVYLYRRNNVGLSGFSVPSTTLTYNFSSGLLSGALEGWSQTMPDASAGRYLIVTQASALGSGASDLISTGEWASPTILAQDGAAGSNGSTTAQVFIYQRSAIGRPVRPSATATYIFASGAVTGLNNGWSAAWPSGTGPVYVSLAIASSSGSYDDISPGEWALPEIAAQDGSPGANGLNSATVYLYRRNNVGLSGFSVPSTTLTYNFSSGLLTGALEGWSQTMPDASAGKYLIVTLAAALGSGATDLIDTSEWAPATVMAQDGTTGANGVTTAQVFIYQRSSIGRPVRPSATATYTFANASVTGLNNGWSATWPSGTGPVYVSLAIASSSGTYDDIAPGEWALPEIAAQDGAPGTNGLNSATVYLYRRNNVGLSGFSVPSTTLTYNFSSGLLTGALEGWSQTMPDASAGKYLIVTQAAALGSGAYDLIETGEWAPATVMAQDGGAGANGLNTALVYIYQRSSTGAPARPSATVTFNFSTGTVSGLNNGWSSSWPSGTGPVYVSLAAASSTIGTDDIAPGEWAAPVIAAQDGAPGSNGLNSATVYLYRRNNIGLSGFSVPSSTLTYNFSTGLLSGSLDGWSQTIPNASAGKYVIYTQASALGSGPTDTIGSGEWATPSVLVQDGSQGDPGTAGKSTRVAFAVVAAGTSPAGGSRTSTGAAGLPASNSWGLGEVWSASTSALGVNQIQLMTVGSHDYTAGVDGTTTWSEPFQATGRYGSLSAITGYMGSLTVDGQLRLTSGELLAGNYVSSGAWPSSGGGFSIGPGAIRLGRYFSWSGVGPKPQWFEVDTSGNLSLPGLSISGGDATFTGSLSAASGTFRGAVFGGYMSSFAWPSSGLRGFYLGPEGLLIGNENDNRGIRISVNTGDLWTPQFQITGGAATFSGSLSAVTGSFGNVTLGGLLYTPGKSNYDSGNGVMLGYYVGQSYFGITSTASGSLKGMWISTSDGVLHVTGGILTGTTINGASFDAFTASVPGGGIGGSVAAGYDRTFDSRSVSVSGGAGTLSYRWAITTQVNNYLPRNPIYLVNANTSTVIVKSTCQANDNYAATVQCTVTDANGRTATTSFDVTVSVV